MSAEKSHAIVLRVTEFSETSCIGSFFTRDFGKLTLIAKGARRPKSPFEAALDVLAVCRIVFLHKSSAMGTLTEAKLERRFRNRRQDLNWLYAAYYVVELLKTLLEEGDPHPELFDLAVSTLAEIDCSRPPSAEQTAVSNDSVESASSKDFELNRCLLRFEVGLLKHLGHFPSLDQCVGCGRLRTTENSVAFGLNRGRALPQVSAVTKRFNASQFGRDQMPERTKTGTRQHRERDCGRTGFRWEQGQEFPPRAVHKLSTKRINGKEVG